ncbi:RNA-binding protein 41-like [Galleria mellonella]|uniref:RNA-binding protein 41-like n=1 Tax=Galleria mellonella TaxID=7137 RepID=A0A6J1WKV2_GALME|nr:RNA-binding protein 41-like [Galleria mellonella]
MCSESLPKEFEKTTEVLPIVTYGISTIEDLRRAEAEINLLEKLRRAGLNAYEMKLYHENELGIVDKRRKIESLVLKAQLAAIYEKISVYEQIESSKKSKEQPSTSKNTPEDVFERLKDKPITIYPDPHPVKNNIKEVSENFFTSELVPITKRRKSLRRFERNKEKVLSQEGQVNIPLHVTPVVNRPGSLWDVKELPKKPQNVEAPDNCDTKPKKNTLYTIRNNKIVRLEPLPGDQGVVEDEYQAVDIVMPTNSAEEQLLEGTKMAVDDIKKIERFKDYEPGIPSKVLYLKNIAPSVTEEQLSLLFNQFMLENGGPVEVNLMSGRMRGQAFASLQNVELAIRALEEVNGTILSGRPIIAQFGRGTTRVQE